MYRWILLFTFTALLLSGCTSLPLVDASQVHAAPALTTNAANAAATTCAVTPPVLAQPPDDPHADPFGFGLWQINADRTIWAAIPPSGVWHMGGEKTIWIRPAGTDLRVQGERIDAPGEPLRVDQPCCYPTGFQVNALFFPSAGCWHVTARAGEHTLDFVIEVQGDGQSAPHARGIDPASPLAKQVLMQSCSAAACELRLIDATTGAANAEYAPHDLRRYVSFSAAQDRSRLALITYRDNTYLRGGELSFLDLATWEQTTTLLTFDGAWEAPLFAPDDAHLLVVTQVGPWPATNTFYLVDVADGALVAEQVLDFYPLRYAFTGDGQGIMVFGTRANTSAANRGDIAEVMLLDAATLEIQWQATVPGLLIGQTLPANSSSPLEGDLWQPATAFAPTVARLYIVHAAEESLTTIDFAARDITTQTITQPVSWIERLLRLTARPVYAKMAGGVMKTAALSAGGSELLVIGTRNRVEGTADAPEFFQDALGLQVIDLTTATVSAHVDTAAQSLTVDPAGRYLYLHGWAQEQTLPYENEWTDVLDAATLEPVAHLDQAVAISHRLDGTPVLLATRMAENGQIEFSVLDAQTLAVISSSTLPSRGYTGWVALP